MRKVSPVSTLPTVLLIAQSAESVCREFGITMTGTQSSFGLTASKGSAVTTWIHDLACVGTEGVHVSADRKQRGKEKGKAWRSVALKDTLATTCSLLLSP